MSLTNRMTWILTAGVLSFGGLGGVAAAAPGNDSRPAANSLYDNDHARRDGDGRYDHDKYDNGRDGRWNGYDNDRNHRVDVKLYRRGAVKIDQGEAKVRDGRALIARGERTHQRSLIRKGQRLVEQGRALISSGELLQRRARA